ncbi:MAG TPA: MerR family transcriptional regulator [Nannocystaceae bacterium]|nr:MerR family transcriptional regulator [Nannocystaceae bacterium]
MEGAAGRYRIQTVAEMTGVGASTLRAWEQRYGFPAPERTASAYRLYSDADVQRIARVRELCDAGMAAAEAVAAVLGDSTSVATTSRAPTSVTGSTGSSPPVDRILAAAARVDPAALDEALRAPLVVASPRGALTGVIEPAWSALRERWLAGEIDRGQERIAAELFGHVVRDVVRLGQPSPSRGHAVLGCFVDDDDLVPLGRVALAMQGHGLRVVLLGARTSPAALASAASHSDAKVLALACSDTTPARARELVDDYARAAGRRPWIVCGPGVVAIAELVRKAGAIVALPSDEDDRGLQAALARLSAKG